MSLLALLVLMYYVPVCFACPEGVISLQFSPQRLLLSFCAASLHVLTATLSVWMHGTVTTVSARLFSFTC